MFKKYVLLAIVLTVIIGCAKNEETADVKAEKTELVKINVDNFFTEATKLVGKKVQLEGTIVHTCKHGGKRAHVIGENPNVKLKLEVTDKVEKFDKEMEGSLVVAEGIVKELIIDKAYLNNWESELKEAGESEKALHEGHEKSHDEMTEQEENLMKIKTYRKQLEDSGKEKLEFYWVDLTKYELKNNS